LRAAQGTHPFLQEPAPPVPLCPGAPSAWRGNMVGMSNCPHDAELVLVEDAPEVVDVVTARVGRAELRDVTVVEALLLANEVCVASDVQLDALCRELWDLRRRPCETDEQLRARLLAYWKCAMQPGTREGILGAVAFYTGIPRARLRLGRAWRRYLWLDVLLWGVTKQQLKDAQLAADQQCAAGIRLQVRRGAWWRCWWASVLEWWRQR
jgi:hypothetical protein